LHNSQKHPSENVHLNKSTDTFNDDQTITFRRDYSYLENRFNNKNSQNKTEEKKGIFSWLKNLF
jgi:translation initiation factor RLI1